MLQSAASRGDRGWHALTVDARGTAHLVWLDHRRLAARPKATEHDHHGDGAGMAQLSDLRYAAVSARGIEHSERALLPGVCYCCKTALVAGPDGRLFAAWRHVYPGNIRDIAFAQSLDGGRTFSAPSRVSEDQWQLAGCPDDGPAMAVDRDGHGSHRLADGDRRRRAKGALFYATSRDGRTFTHAQRVPTLGSPKPIASADRVRCRRAQRSSLWDEVVDGSRRAVGVDATRLADGSLRFGEPQRSRGAAHRRIR